MAKLKAIDITGLNNISDIMDKCHIVFKNTLANKNNLTTFAGKAILVPLKWIEFKAELFWHVASIEKKPKLNIQPCINDIVSSKCDNNCVNSLDPIILSDGEREKCIYRAIRVGWIREIIDLYNTNDPRIKYWEKINSDGRNRIYLRYQEEEIDYIVILENYRQNKVRLITGYPIFFISAKKDYEKDYQTYQKSLQ